MKERLRNYFLLLRMLPQLAVSRQRRQLLAEMMGFVRSLPQLMKQPLPEAMQALTADAPQTLTLSEPGLRDLADLASALERRSVPGICLRRSLTRFRYMMGLGLPFEVVFGARLVAGAEKRDLKGHAWLEKAGVAYCESAENYEDFTPMFRWPPASAPQSQSPEDAGQARLENRPLES